MHEIEFVHRAGMHVGEGTTKDVLARRSPEEPVMVDEWAEVAIDIARLQSRRRHPSNREPAWAKDGGYESTEWVI